MTNAFVKMARTLVLLAAATALLAGSSVRASDTDQSIESSAKNSYVYKHYLAGDSIGTHLEGSFTWTTIPDRLSFETGFGHLWAGRFAEQTAGAAFRGDPQYYYFALTTTF